MNKLRQRSVAVGAGVATAIGGYFFMESLYTSPAASNEQVVACSHALGKAAVKTNVIPVPCTDFKDSFRRQTVTVTLSSPRNNDPSYTDTKTLSETNTYFLPPASEFYKENWIDPSQSKRDRNEEALMMGAIAGVLIGGGMGLMFWSQNYEYRRADQVAAAGIAQ